MICFSSSGVSGFLEDLTDGTPMTLGQIVQRLKETYCNSVGVVCNSLRYLVV
jgi:hypothetical protein